MKPSDYAVDNADTGPASHHPCYSGEGKPLKHSYVRGVCEDCEVECDHEDRTIASDSTGTYEVCEECGEDIDPDDGDREYDAWKDDRRA